MPEPKRDQPTRRMEGLPSLPSPNPEAAPGHLHLKAPGSPGTQGHPLQGGLHCPSPCPVLLASPIPRWAGQCWWISQQGDTCPTPRSHPVAMNLEQRPGWEAKGVPVIHSPAAPHVATPHTPGLLHLAPLQRGLRSQKGLRPSRKLHFCFFREWVATAQGSGPTSFPGSHPHSLSSPVPLPNHLYPLPGDTQQDRWLTAPAHTPPCLLRLVLAEQCPPKSMPTHNL